MTTLARRTRMRHCEDRPRGMTWADVCVEHRPRTRIPDGLGFALLFGAVMVAAIVTIVVLLAAGA